MRRVTSRIGLLWLALALAAPVAASGPSAEQILKKAESVRNPELAYAVDFTIHGTKTDGTKSERDASYSMIASGKDRTVILMRAPEALYGTLMLMAEDRYWMLLPKASRPWELSVLQMQTGDVATGDIARTNFLRGYTVRLDGEEPLDGEACVRLELVRDDALRYSRVLYWVAKKTNQPRKLEQYDRPGALLRVVRYHDFRKGPLGLRSMTLSIDSVGSWKESSTLTFSNLRRLDVPGSSFTPEGLLPMRDAALAGKGSGTAPDVPIERMLESH